MNMKLICYLGTFAVDLLTHNLFISSMRHGHVGNRRTTNNMLYRGEEEVPSGWQGKLITVESGRIYDEFEVIYKCKGDNF